MLHINQVEFDGEPAKADTKFGSKITQREMATQVEPKQYSTQLGTVTIGNQILLNNSSERQDFQLRQDVATK